MKLIHDCSLQTLRDCYAIVFYDDGGQHLLEVNESLALLFQRAKAGSFSAETLASVLQEYYELPHETAVSEAAKAISLWTLYRLTEP